MNLLQDRSEDVLVPVCGIFREITTRSMSSHRFGHSQTDQITANIRNALYRTDMLQQMCRHLQSDNVALQTQCAFVLFNCNQDSMFHLDVCSYVC